MKDLTKYLLPLLVLIAIATGVLKLNKKPRWITPTELNFTLKTPVFVKVQPIYHPIQDSDKDTLRLFAKPASVLIVKVPKNSHPIALEINGTRVDLTKTAPTIYKSEPVDIKGTMVKAKLIFAPRPIYKLPLQALHFQGEKAYITIQNNGTKELPVKIVKRTNTHYFVIGKLQGVKVKVP